MPGVLEIDFTKVKRKIRSAPGSAKTSPTLTRKGTVAEISSNCFDIYKCQYGNCLSLWVSGARQYTKNCYRDLTPDLRQK